MEQFVEECFKNEAGKQFRLTCTLCTKTIGFTEARHSQLYRDKHAELCKPPKTAAQQQCPEERFIRGPGGMYYVQCILAAGHPAGPEYSFFTDFQGHIWPKLEKKS